MVIVLTHDCDASSFLQFIFHITYEQIEQYWLTVRAVEWLRGYLGSRNLNLCTKLSCTQSAYMSTHIKYIKMRPATTTTKCVSLFFSGIFYCIFCWWGKKKKKKKNNITGTMRNDSAESAFERFFPDDKFIYWRLHSSQDSK